eukprot:Colp12_sorted_trinity150504_noHs@16853
MEKKARLGLTSLQLLMARSYRSAAASSSLLAKHRKNDGSRVVDFRSDTVTVPCDGMKEAMLSAPVGDDVFEEDPTVKKLETYVADLCGKEAGLFVPSGTMANQLAVRVHVGALDSVLLDHRAHVLNWEAGGIAFHSQAIEHNWPRMAQVHTETKRLAEGLTGLGLEVVNSVETNMVFLDVGRHTPKGLTIETLVAALAAENILIAPRSATSTRMVLHHQITGDDITRTLEVIRKVLPQ